MDFFDKLRTTLSPLRQVSSSTQEPLVKTWTLNLPSFKENSIRLLLYRDCDRRGRKCLYDSHHVVRDTNGKFSYVPTGSSTEMKNLSEYIFGCVPLCSSKGTKRFHKFCGKFVWSQVFCPRGRTRGQSGDSTKSGELTSSTSSEAENPVDLKTATGTNASLPNIAIQNCKNIKTSLSLPSRLEVHQKTLLGLAISVETNSENKESLGPYLLSLSRSLEDSSDWFASIASKAYCKPNTFVQTLYDFSQEFTGMLYSRLTSPLISTVTLSPCWRTLPNLTTELVNLLLRLDSCLCKASERLKLVIVGGNNRKTCQEAKALLYLFKLLLLKCKDEEEIGVDAVASVCEIVSTSKSSPSLLQVPCSTSLTTNTSTPTTSENPQIVQVIQQHNFVIPQQPKIEHEKLQKREYDSGIDMNFSNISIKGMRKSVSQNFDSSDSCSGFSSDEGIGMTKMKTTKPMHSKVHEYEEVSFHLGEFETDANQSINTLGLGEPNLRKLKIHRSTISYFEPVQDQIETLSSDPIEVKLDFNSELSTPVSFQLPSYCQYCDSVASVNKFSPLYYIQWLKSGTGITEQDFNLMKNFNSKFVIINLEKSFISTVNFEFCPTNCTLVSSLIDKINFLSSAGRECEIEEFLQAQIDSMKKIAQDFRKSFQTSSDFQLFRKDYSHLSENDFDLINFLAKKNFPYLKSVDFV